MFCGIHRNRMQWNGIWLFGKYIVWHSLFVCCTPVNKQTQCSSFSTTNHGPSSSLLTPFVSAHHGLEQQWQRRPQQRCHATNNGRHLPKRTVPTTNTQAPAHYDECRHLSKQRIWWVSLLPLHRWHEYQVPRWHCNQMTNDELDSLFVIFVRLVTTRNGHPTTATSTDKHSPALLHENSNDPTTSCAWQHNQHNDNEQPPHPPPLLRDNSNEPRHPVIMPNGHHAKRPPTTTATQQQRWAPTTTTAWKRQRAHNQACMATHPTQRQWATTPPNSAHHHRCTTKTRSHDTLPPRQMTTYHHCYSTTATSTPHHHHCAKTAMSPQPGMHGNPPNTMTMSDHPTQWPLPCHKRQRTAFQFTMRWQESHPPSCFSLFDQRMGDHFSVAMSLTATWQPNNEWWQYSSSFIHTVTWRKHAKNSKHHNQAGVCRMLQRLGENNPWEPNRRGPNPQQHDDPNAEPWEPPNYFRAGRFYCVETIVAPCGVVIAWTKFAKSESPTNILNFLGKIYPTEESRPDYICIDKGCQVLATAVANGSWEIWKETTRFIVDAYHYINHRVADFLCRKYCNPSPGDGSAPNLVVIAYDKNGRPYLKRAFNTQVFIHVFY